MAPMTHQLAQVNLSRLVAPLDDSRLRGFARASGPMDAAARRAPGFVWRMPVEDAAEAQHGVFRDEVDGAAGLVTNISVWVDLDSLLAYVRGRVHRPMFRRTPEWFLPMARVSHACWWVPEGHRPTAEEAADRLGRLRSRGPTSAAFTLDEPFAPPT